MVVNAAGDALEFVDQESTTDTILSAIEVADMNSSYSTYDTQSGAYATVATPTSYSNSDGTTERIIITKMTIKVPSELDSGVGFRIAVINDSDSSESSVIDDGRSSDIEASTYIIDGILQTVTMSPLQHVQISLVDSNGDPIATSSSVNVNVLTEYKTIIQ